MFRTRTLLLLLATLALASPVPAADPPAKKWINLPPRAIQASPATPADAPIQLDFGKWYVYDTEVAAINLVSPGGLIKVDRQNGPITLYGTFVGSTAGEPEMKSFAGKFVYIVTAVKGKAGATDLFAIPTGVKDESEIVKVGFNVGSGPAPPVVPEKSQFVKDLQAAYTADASATKAADLAGLIDVYTHGRDSAVGAAATWGDLFEKLALKAGEKKVGGKVMGVQKVIQEEIKDSLPWQKMSKTAMDMPAKESAKFHFDRVVKALSEVK